MNGFRELDTNELTQVEGGGILSFLGGLLSEAADAVGSALTLAWQTFKNPLRPMT
jgi:bacteriocin-like protein